MSKTVTLRISEDSYARFKAYAQAENRKLANAIETLAARQLEESVFVDRPEMDEILADKELLKRMAAGSGQARKLKGRFVG
jgi:hypothetical protein